MTVIWLHLKYLLQLIKIFLSALIPFPWKTAKAIAAVKVNKAAALERDITAEALKGSGDQMIDTIHAFCSEVYATLSQRRKWITNVIIPLQKKGDFSLMTNYKATRLVSDQAAAVYNRSTS